MIITFTTIFILSMAGAAAWGYYNHYTAVGYIISLAVAGFIGSSIIALVFCYLYFYQGGSGQEAGSEPDRASGPDPHPDARPAVPPPAQLPPTDPKETKQIKK